MHPIIETEREIVAPRLAVEPLPAAPARSWWVDASLPEVALGTVVVALTLLGLFLLVELRTVLLLLFLSIVLATALAPLSVRLRRFGVERTLAQLIAFTLLILLVLGIIATLVPFFVTQLLTVAGKLPGGYAALRTSLGESSLSWLRLIGSQLPANPFAGSAGGDGADLGAGLVNQLPSVGNSMVVTLLLLLLTYYWLAYRPQAIDAIARLLPEGWRAEALGLWQEIEAKLGAFVRGLALMGLAIGLLSGIGYWLIGLPYAFTIAVIAALLEAIPYIGPFITMTLAVLIGVSVSPALGGLTLLVALVIQFFEGYVIVPRVMDRAIGVHAVVTLLALGVFADLFGLLGAVLAIPLAAVFQVLLDRLSKRTLLPEQLPLQARDRLSQLRAKSRALATTLQAQQGGAAQPNGGQQVAISELNAWLKDLDGILAQREGGQS